MNEDALLVSVISYGDRLVENCLTLTEGVLFNALVRAVILVEVAIVNEGQAAKPGLTFNGCVRAYLRGQLAAIDGQCVAGGL
ncbi:MAG TPA: hypothetical protein VGC67_01925 [Cellulomonas sp.]